MKVSVQKSVGFLRFSNFVKFAKQKEKPAQMPGFLSKFTGGSGWIRTTSGLSQQIYSLPRLSNSGARPELFVRLYVANKDGPSSLRYAAALNFQSSLSHR